MRPPPAALPQRRAAPSTRLAAVLLALGTLGPGVALGAHDSQQLLLVTEGNRLRRFDIDSLDRVELLEDVLIESAGGGAEGGGVGAAGGRDVNGMICPLPDGSGRFVLGEDTDQPLPKPGWGLFSHTGEQLGKLTPTSFVPNAEPFGCAFAPDGTLFTTEVGGQGFGENSGQLIQWFPPFDHFPGPAGAYPDTDAVSDNFCKIAVDLGTATGIAIDELGRVYVAASAEGRVYRFSPPFPTGPDAAGGCSEPDALGSPVADPDRVNREVFIDDARARPPTGIARAPNGHWYVASVLFGRIAEFDREGSFVRVVMQPEEDDFELPKPTGSPQGLAVDRAGNLYYADLDLRGEFFTPSPGPDGKVRRIRFDEHGEPLPPETIRAGLAFPDGVALLPGDLTPWPSYAGGPRRLFFNPNESILTPENVRDLRLRWRFTTQGAITGSPSVALVDVPGEGRLRVVYFLSWDGNVYAVRLADGSELWRFATEEQPGAAFPTAASADVSLVDGSARVFIGSGELFYALDAASGEEIWRFVAGTGCRDALGNPPGLCGFRAERNQIESSALAHGDRVYFGMDVNDVATGRGGFYALDARDGRMVWFFDPESGSVCRPRLDDEVRAFDGYHSEEELGLPAGFFADPDRPGCDFDRTPTGCANIWSSPALDAGRGLLYIGTSNCDTDDDPATPIPSPPMPPYDEALVALHLDGSPAWRWRPRDIDNDDLAFGAAPQLFSIRTADGSSREVVGIGNKDGTYYVLDRDGLNEENGVRWDDADAWRLPYWATQVVPGGDIGGILATSAVDELARRVYLSTAIGQGGIDGIETPQRPTVHALDLDTGEVIWDNADELRPLASFAPTSATPGLVFVGHVPFAFLRIFESARDRGVELTRIPLDNFAALTSAPSVVGGTVLAGAGIGTRTESGTSQGDTSADTPSDLTAWCVPGTLDCHPCVDAFDNDADGAADYPGDDGCSSAADLSEEYDCDDGLDNDGDGLRDFPDDPDCTGPAAVTEVPEAARLLLGVGGILAAGLLARRRRRPHGS